MPTHPWLSAIAGLVTVLGALLTSPVPACAQPAVERPILARPGLFQSLTEPPCSYCSTQHRKGLVKPDDRVLAWIRGAHNGGAIPLRHFLAGPRVINDTYGLFFFDADGGYVAAYNKDYGYEFHGWRGGVMVVKSRDGTLWSALSGRAIAGPMKGRRLSRVPSVMTDWSHWLMLHPESTAYDLFDGQTYKVRDLPLDMNAGAAESMGTVDPRLKPTARVHGVEVGDAAKAFPLDEKVERACYLDEVGGVPLAVFWYAPTKSSVAFRRQLDDRQLTFFADEVSPETAPFKDRETGSRWTLAGRCVDGPLKGRELTWVDGVQCRWYAWVAEFPATAVLGEVSPALPALRALLLDPARFDDVRAATLEPAHFNAVVLDVDRAAGASSDQGRSRLKRAAETARRHGLPFYYWIEVGRCPALADAHPEWMASLQGHPEWRRLFPGTREPGEDEVARTYPWVPILSREGFDAQLARVTGLLNGLPQPAGVFLNDLQGAPSACGCGHPLCRWTTDYGPKRTTKELGPDAAAQFIDAVRTATGTRHVIPVWVTECESHDKHTHCAGVACYEGRCWKEFVRQLTPLADRREPLALLAPFRAFERDLPIYPEHAGYVREAIELMHSQPTRHRSTSMLAGNLIAVLQGWDVTPREVQAQIAQARLAGTHRYIVAQDPIEQSWEPRISRWK